MVNRQEQMRSIKKPPKKDLPRLATNEEMQDRLRKAKFLESMGISTSKFDGDEDFEDEDILRAIILVNKGEEVPEELIEKIKN